MSFCRVQKINVSTACIYTPSLEMIFFFAVKKKNSKLTGYTNGKGWFPLYSVFTLGNNS